MGKGHEGNRGSRSEERGVLQPQHAARIWTVVETHGKLCQSLLPLPSFAVATSTYGRRGLADLAEYRCAVS